MNLARKLAAARKRAGLSQAALAKRVGVSPGTVGGWETTGKHAHGMAIERLLKVAKILGVDLAELVA